MQAFLQGLGLPYEVEDDDIFLDCPAAGVVLCAHPNTRRVTSIFHYSDAPKTYSPFRGQLPNGVTFGMSRQDLRTTFGEPTLPIPPTRVYNSDGSVGARKPDGQGGHEDLGTAQGGDNPTPSATAIGRCEGMPW